MSTQLTVRLADDSVQHLDAMVESGAFASRAQYIGWLLRREAQRQAALEDLDKLRKAGALPQPYPDLADVMEATARRPLDI